MSRPQRLPSGRWRIRFFDGAGVRQGKTFTSESAARAALRRHSVEADDVRAGRAPAPPAPSPTFSSYVADTLLKALDEPGAHKHSERLTTRSIVTNHLLPAFGKSRLDAIDRAAGLRFRTTLAGKGLAPKTIHNVLQLLTRILRDAEDRGELPKAPSFKLGKAARLQRRQAMQPIDRDLYLDADELERLLAVTQDAPGLHAMVLMASRAGLRAGELRALRWCDLDLERDVVTIRLADYKGVIDTPKSGVTRTVPLGGRVREALDKLPKGLPAAAVFGGTSEKATTLGLIAAAARANLRLALAKVERMRACRRFAKLRKRSADLSPEQQAELAAYEQSRSLRFGWHTLRHTFCSHLAMAGTAALLIKEWAGHESIETTQRYMHLAPAQRYAAAAIDALDQAVEHRSIVSIA